MTEEPGAQPSSADVSQASEDPPAGAAGTSGESPSASPSPSPETAVPRRPRVPAKCPVCRASFRGTTACSRCGTDLGPIMRILAEAWHAAERCRAALRAGDLPLALRWSARRQQLRADEA